MPTPVLFLLTFSLGVCIGYVLCAVMTVASEEQRRGEHAEITDESPLEPDSLP